MRVKTKRTLIFIIVSMLLAAATAGCARTSMKEVVDAIDADFMADVGTHAVPVGRAELPQDDFLIKTGLSASDIKDYYGVVSSDEGYSDRIFAIRADKKAVETVKTALLQHKSNLTTYYRAYSVNGSYQRAKLSILVQRGDCLFYICLGIMPTDTDAPLEFGVDLDIAVNVINTYFPAENAK